MALPPARTVALAKPRSFYKAAPAIKRKALREILLIVCRARRRPEEATAARQTFAKLPQA